MPTNTPLALAPPLALALWLAATAFSVDARAEASMHGEKAARAVELHDEARELYKRGEYRRAIEVLERAHELDPEAGELLFNLGVVHEKLGEPTKAAERYRAALRVDKDPERRQRAETALRRVEGASKEVPLAPSRVVVSPVVWAGVGATTAALGVGVGLAVGAWATHPADAITGPALSWIDVLRRASSAHELASAADVAFAAAGVLGAATLVVALTPLGKSTTPARPAPHASVPVWVALTPSSVHFGGRF